MLHQNICFFSPFELILHTLNFKFYRIMKKTIILVLMLLFSLQLFADNRQEVIILSHKGGLRNGYPLYQDMPEVYYCYDAKTQTQWIIINGGGAVAYYDVEISSPVTNTVEITTQVDGTYDTFDISSLPMGSHVITIESPSGNIFEGTFTTY